MAILTRRSVLRSSVGFAAAGALGRPYIANAQAKTIEVWFAQGFAEEEDPALRNPKKVPHTGHPHTQKK